MPATGSTARRLLDSRHPSLLQRQLARTDSSPAPPSPGVIESSACSDVEAWAKSSRPKTSSSVTLHACRSSLEP